MLQKKVERLSTEVGMNYKFLGSVSTSILNDIKLNVESRRNSTKQFEVIFPEHIEQLYQAVFPPAFQSIIEHSKVFVTAPGYSYPIHKDGYDKKCALNIAIDCNLTDWVRWYSADAIITSGGVEQLNHGKYHDGTQYYSRNVKIKNIEDVQPVEEIHNHPGDVYLVNTDVYHTFKNNGDSDRLIIQTKFKDNLSIDEVYSKVQEMGLNFQ